MLHIDYRKLDESQNTYAKKGYRLIEVPWMVPLDPRMATSPGGRIDALIQSPFRDGNYLVASGEQGFLHLMSSGLLPPGAYQSVTPCFRDEQVDFLHRKTFMKNELIKTDEVSRKALDGMVEDALAFFSMYLPRELLIVKEEPAHGAEINLDIMVNVHGEFMEIGSYGIRRSGYLRWVYGTGCAEPRLSAAVAAL